MSGGPEAKPRVTPSGNCKESRAPIKRDGVGGGRGAAMQPTGQLGSTVRLYHSVPSKSEASPKVRRISEGWLKVFYAHRT